MKKIFITVIFTIMFLTAPQINAAEVSTEAMLQYNQGIDYYKVGQYDQAITCFRSAINIEPNYIDAYYNLGTTLEYLQQYDAALVVFKQIIVRKPDDYDSVYKAAWLSAKLGENQKAKTYLSIIPPTSTRAKDAQELSKQLNISQQGPQIPQHNQIAPTEAITPAVSTKVVSLQAKPAVSQTSGIYENLAAPTGITSDNDGNIYVAEYNNNSIIKITPDGKKIVYIKNSKISGPIGIALDKSKNIYIANYNKDNVLKVSPLGEVSPLISNVKKPYCLYIVGNVLLISCQGSDSVLRYKLP